MANLRLHQNKGNNDHKDLRNNDNLVRNIDIEFYKDIDSNNYVSKDDYNDDSNSINKTTMRKQVMIIMTMIMLLTRTMLKIISMTWAEVMIIIISLMKTILQIHNDIKLKDNEDNHKIITNVMMTL